MTVRVMVNAYWIRPGVVGGSEEYTTRLLRSVHDHAPSGIEIHLGAAREYRNSQEVLAAFTGHDRPVGGDNRVLRVVLESTVMAARSQSFDVVHHFGGRHPLVGPGPSLVTIHDTQPIDEPQHFGLVKRHYLARALRATVDRADLVVTPSSWVRDRIVERLGADPVRTRVISSTFDRQPDEPDRHTIELLDRLARHRVILYPAVTHPHKGHITLLDAFARLRTALPQARLVLTGGPGRSHREVLERIGGVEGVEHLGRISTSTLAHLLRHAAVLAFPSRYEGFGLPILEAMAAGTPVVAADATALTEVVGDGGLLVPGSSVEDWADALRTVLEDASVADALVDAGRARAEHYSPSVAAERLVRAWTDAAAMGRSR